MKLLIILALALACISCYSQTNNETTTVPIFLSEAYDTIIGQGLTNLTVAGYGTYTPSVHKWGYGGTLIRNLPIGGGVSTGIGVGLDEYNESLYGVTAQVSLKASVRPFSGWGGWWTNVVTTPLTYIGLGTPFGSFSTTSGDLETIAAVGDALWLGRVFGADINLVGLYGTRSGLGAAGGIFYGGGVAWTWRF